MGGQYVRTPARPLSQWQVGQGIVRALRRVRQAIEPRPPMRYDVTNPELFVAFAEEGNLTRQ